MIDTGRYNIVNYGSGNLAVLHDPNESDLVAGLNEGKSGEKWDIMLLSNRKFTIRNYGHELFAHCGHRATTGGGVNSKGVLQQFVIKESRFRNKYTIAPSDNPDVFWGVPDDEIGTPLELGSTPTHKRYLWSFEPADP